MMTMLPAKPSEERADDGGPVGEAVLERHADDGAVGQGIVDAHADDDAEGGAAVLQRRASDDVACRAGLDERITGGARSNRP